MRQDKRKQRKSSGFSNKLSLFQKPDMNLKRIAAISKEWASC